MIVLLQWFSDDRVVCARKEHRNMIHIQWFKHMRLCLHWYSTLQA
jgi:hypothetical protein